jgi:translation elongation factor EF-Tu-like GTPase
MTMPPMDSEGSQLWMTVDDAFRIRGRGTVVTGQLQGNGELSVGDTMTCNGQRWQVGGIEQFGAVLTAALPGWNIGVLVADENAAGSLRGWTVQFEPGASPGGSQGQFTVLAPRKKRWRR